MRRLRKCTFVYNTLMVVSMLYTAFLSPVPSTGMMLTWCTHMFSFLVLSCVYDLVTFALLETRTVGLLTIKS